MQWGLPAFRVTLDLIAAATVGLLLAAAALLPSSKDLLATAPARARDSRPGSPGPGRSSRWLFSFSRTPRPSPPRVADVARTHQAAELCRPVRARCCLARCGIAGRVRRCRRAGSRTSTGCVGRAAAGDRCDSAARRHRPLRLGRKPRHRDVIAGRPCGARRDLGRGTHRAALVRAHRRASPATRRSSLQSVGVLGLPLRGCQRCGQRLHPARRHR